VLEFTGPERTGMIQAKDGNLVYSPLADFKSKFTRGSSNVS
jgi:hypothetical protein